ncbi:MAG: hypothetical protein EOP58_12765 [Sphingomonadales bacterium]|nr:MAG: hypothetical protein EOP58_12765 [Sphingomonadales bacterium]
MRDDLPDALSEAIAPFALGAAIGIRTIGPTLDALSACYGGLWVGGRATLTQQSLSFEPNAINQRVHADGHTLRLDIPLVAIDAVISRFGILTGIIDIVAGGATVSIRCFRSKQFAASIRRAREDVRPSPSPQPRL